MFTILVVDDEPSVRKPVCRLLSGMNGADRVIEASDGAEAMDLLARQQVQLVITDIRMPRTDGLELAEHIKTNYPDTDVYVLTGHAEFDYALQAMEHQVAGYLLKPLSKHKLTEVYETAYEKYRGRRDQHQVTAIRGKALLEKRIQDLLHDVPLPTFDEVLVPKHEQIVLVSFSTQDLQSLGETSVRSFIRGCAYETFDKLGTPVVCAEERLVTIVLFATAFDATVWEDQVKATARWMQDKLRIPIKTGDGGSTTELKDLSLLYIRSMINLGFSEISRRGAGERLSPIVRELLAYIRREFAGCAQLADFARAFQVNANYLSHLFHEETGMTYSQYLTQYRLAEAKRLLRESHLKIYEVCERAGYRDPAYFSRMFKTVEGMSPNDYRTYTASS